MFNPASAAAGGAVVWRDDSLPVPAAAGTGGPLVLRHCTPSAGPVRAQVVVAAAIGVPQTFYAAFAAWLAGHGYAVTTFDYRGHAASLHGRLRNTRVNLLDWADDCAAVAQRVAQQAPELPLYWLGHSVGSQLPGMSLPALPIDGMLSIASGSGYWRDNATPTRRKVLLWWWGIAPLVTALCGCLPGKRWGLVGDLPAGVVWQWRRWCMHPDYGLGVEGARLRTAYDAARYPLYVFSVEDDEMMSWRSTQSLVGWYRNAPHTIERLRLCEVPQPRIGHFGFFRSDMADSLWPRALAVLEGWRARSAGGSAAQPPQASPQGRGPAGGATNAAATQTAVNPAWVPGGRGGAFHRAKVVSTGPRAQAGDPQGDLFSEAP